ncbi:MAG: hypothetical protein IJP90_03100 [Treponema sp.]|nr:hypothetical protein [Treponema sp.]
MFIRKTLIPLQKHIDWLNLIQEKYIRTEQNSKNSNNAIFIEQCQLRIHKELHQNEDSVLLCEEIGNTNCYVSSFSIITTSENNFLQKCLIKGHLPENTSEIVLNKSLTRRLKCQIGSILCIKNAIFF